MREGTMRSDPSPDTPPDESAGDAACWAHLLCTECGRVLEPGDRISTAADRDEDDKNEDDEPLCAACRRDR